MPLQKHCQPFSHLIVQRTGVLINAKAHGIGRIEHRQFIIPYIGGQQDEQRLRRRDQDVGRVARIEQSPAHDLWVVADGERERLIPAVAEIVVEVDLAAGRVVIRPPDGLLDL